MAAQEQPIDPRQIIVARDVGDFVTLMQRLLAENANIRRYQIRVMLGTIKGGLLVQGKPLAE